MYFQDESHIEYLRGSLQVSWQQLQRNQKKKQKRKISQSLSPSNSNSLEEDDAEEDPEDEILNESNNEALEKENEEIDSLNSSNYKTPQQQNFDNYVEYLRMTSRKITPSKKKNSQNSQQQSILQALRNRKKNSQEPPQKQQKTKKNQPEIIEFEKNNIQKHLQNNLKQNKYNDPFMYEKCSEILILNSRLFDQISHYNNVKPYDLALHTVKHLQYVKIPKNQTLFHFSEHPQYFYIVLSGQISIWSKKQQDLINYLKGKEHDYHAIIDEYTQQLEKIKKIQQEDYQILGNDKQMNDQIQELENLIKKEQNNIKNLSSEHELQFLQHIDPNLHHMYKMNNITLVSKLATLKKGAQLGEVALIQDEKRSATAFVEQEAELLLIEKKNFVKIFRPFYDILNFSLSKLSSILNNTQKQEIVNFSYYFESTFYKFRDVICRQGEKADTIYLIQNGQVELQQIVHSSEDLDLPANYSQNSNIQQQYLKKVKARQTSPEKKKRINVSTKRLCILSTGEFFGYEDILEKKNRTYEAVAISERVDMLRLNKQKLHNYPQDEIKEILKKIALQQQKFLKSQEPKLEKAQKKLSKKVKQEIQKINQMIEESTSQQSLDVHQIQENYTVKSKHQKKMEKLKHSLSCNQLKKSVFSQSKIKEPNFQIKQIYQVVKDRKVLQKHQRNITETHPLEVQQQKQLNIGLLNISDLHINISKKKQKQFKELSYQKSSNSLFSQWLTQADYDNIQKQKSLDQTPQATTQDLNLIANFDLLKERSQENTEKNNNNLDDSLKKYEKKIQKYQYQSQQSLFQIQQLKQQKLRKRNYKSSLTPVGSTSMIDFFDKQIGPHIYTKDELEMRKSERSSNHSKIQQQQSGQKSPKMVDEIIEFNRKTAEKRLSSLSTEKTPQNCINQSDKKQKSLYFPDSMQSQKSTQQDISQFQSTANFHPKTYNNSTIHNCNESNTNNNSILSPINKKNKFSHPNLSENPHNQIPNGQKSVQHLRSQSNLSQLSSHNNMSQQNIKNSLYDSIQQKIQNQKSKSTKELINLIQKNKITKNESPLKKNSFQNLESLERKKDFSQYQYQPGPIQELAKIREKINKKILIRKNRMHPTNMSYNEKVMLPILQEYSHKKSNSFAVNNNNNNNNNVSSTTINISKNNRRDSFSRSPIGKKYEIQSQFFYNGGFNRSIHARSVQKSHYKKNDTLSSDISSFHNTNNNNKNNNNKNNNNKNNNNKNSMNQTQNSGQKVIDIQKRKQFQTNVLENALESLSKFPQQKILSKKINTQTSQTNFQNSQISPLKKLENTLQELNKQQKEFISHKNDLPQQQEQKLIKIQSLQAFQNNPIEETQQQQQPQQEQQQEKQQCFYKINGETQTSHPEQIQIMSTIENQEDINDTEGQETIPPKWKKKISRQNSLSSIRKQQRLSHKPQISNTTEREMLEILKKEEKNKQITLQQQQVEEEEEKPEKQQTLVNSQFSPTKQYPSLNLSLNLNKSVFSKSTGLQSSYQNISNKFSFGNINMNSTNLNKNSQQQQQNNEKNKILDISNDSQSISNSSSSIDMPYKISYPYKQDLVQEKKYSQEQIPQQSIDELQSKIEKNDVKIEGLDIQSQDLDQKIEQNPIRRYFQDSPIRRNFGALSSSSPKKRGMSIKEMKVQLQISQEENRLSQQEVLEVEKEDEEDQEEDENINMNNEIKRKSKKSSIISHHSKLNTLIYNYERENKLQKSQFQHEEEQEQEEEKIQQEGEGEEDLYQMEISQPFQEENFTQAAQYCQLNSNYNIFSPELSSPDSTQYNNLLKSPSYTLSASNPSSPFDTLRDSYDTFTAITHNNSSNFNNNNTSNNNLMSTNNILNMNNNNNNNIVTGYGSQRVWRPVKTPMEEDLKLIRRSQIATFNKYTKDNKFAANFNNQQLPKK